MAIKKNRADENRKRAQRKAEVEKIMEKHAGDDKMVDMDELREILTELQGGRPPLPKDLLWCMAEGDKDKSGQINQGELFLVLEQFKKYVDSQPDLVALIKKHDKNKDMKLDDQEMKRLLDEVTGADCSKEDVQIVNKYFKQFLKESADPSVKGIDPDALAKAISKWDDEQNLSEGMFAGLVDAASFDATGSWNKVQEFFSGVSGCCGTEREKPPSRPTSNEFKNKNPRSSTGKGMI